MADTIFTFLDSILFDKQLNNRIKYEEAPYNPYMANRWASMYSTDVAEIVNETTNRYWAQIPLKEDHYKFLLYLLPKQKRKKISYIKKTKEEKSTETSNSSLIAKNLELSTREIDLYKKIIAESHASC